MHDGRRLRGPAVCRRGVSLWLPRGRWLRGQGHVLSRAWGAHVHGHFSRLRMRRQRGQPHVQRSTERIRAGTPAPQWCLLRPGSGCSARCGIRRSRKVGPESGGFAPTGQRRRARAREKAGADEGIPLGEVRPRARERHFGPLVAFVAQSYDRQCGNESKLRVGHIECAAPAARVTRRPSDGDIRSH
jgi:hypothetical protein